MIPVEQIASLQPYYRKAIPSDYLDIMGHMNICWYVALYQEAVWGFLADLGITKTYIQQQKKGLFASTHYIQYFSEVYGDETVAISTRLLGYSAKRLHFMQFMINENKGNLASTIEVLAVHVDLLTRHSAPFPENITHLLEAVKIQHQTLEWEPSLSGIIQP